MPKFFTSSEQEPTRKVLRIQHKDTGHGPYTSDNQAVQDIMAGSNLPSPQKSGGWHPQDIEHLESPDVPKKFGFVDEKQMVQSVGQDKLDKLKEHGFEPTWVDADHIWHGDNKQIFFSTPKASKKRQQAVEQMKERTKYKEFSPEEIAAINQSRSFKKNLEDIKDLLDKGMMNSGLGGPGSIKAGAVLPSINTMVPKVGNNSKTPSVNPVQSSKKNPIKQAQQIQNKDIKDIKMKEAQAAFKINKSEEVVKFNENGQWSLEKSGYKGYTDEDNARRKANNLGETTGIHIMDSIKRYGGSGVNALNRQVSSAKAKSKKNPVKIFSTEEIETENKKRGLVKKTAREEMLETLEKGRCWEGYKPVKGKKPYEKGSCEPVSKQDVEIAPENSNNRKTYLDQFEKDEKPFHGYNKDKHSRKGGMSTKAREKHNRETGSNLQKPVTSKEAKNSEKKANRRKSFCARMSGVKGPTSKDGKLTRKGAALKRWDC